MMKRIYLLPNIITTANLVCGMLAMLAAFKGDFARACWLIVIAGICDSLDGRVARMAKATSAFGVQYDSLSDLTSFGIAPAILFYSYALNQFDRFGVTLSVFYTVCAALRLARFNVAAEEKIPTVASKKIRKGYFQGLPSPAAAGIAIASILFQNEFNLVPENFLVPFFAVLAVSLASFMVSSIPFPSFKEVNWRSKGKAWILMIPIVVILCLFQAPEITLFAVGYSYLFFSLGWGSYVTLRDKKSVQQG